MDAREPARAGAAPPGAAAGAVEGTDAEVHRPEKDDGSDVPWAGVGVVVLVLVTGAFAAGWHFGRRWGRLMGW